MESALLWAALCVYVLAGSLAIIAVVMGKKPERLILGLMLVGLILHTSAIGVRWNRLGHGPFGTMYEILSSNIWSLMLALVLSYWRIPKIRPIAATVIPILFIMMGWLLLADSRDSTLPATYDTIWLYIHIGFGKVFLGATLIAVGLSVVILLRYSKSEIQRFPSLPSDKALDELAYRFMGLGLIFDTLMLVAGAIWAQDAWGRYWSWDPLETWSLITWLFLALALHIRPLLQPSPRFGAVMVILVFIVAFITFFGFPFISTSAHQGVV
ncbi:MAG: cytochrome c biogenesis protein CcsA [Magnetococcales bacterium]|nr:cytochrome c biogenesis protein CcsA [Magnetococcales bacterium]